MRDRRNTGLVSSEAPLISNLNIWENVALIKQYHQNMPENQAKKLALRHLKRLGLENIADIRDPDLKEKEVFCGMLLRAAMVVDAVIFIDRPFKLLPTVMDSTFIYNTLKKIDDLYKQCYIFDYIWNKNKYGTDYAEKG